MKKLLKKATLGVSLLVLASIVYFVSCRKGSSTVQENNHTEENLLSTKAHLGANVYLPAGTKWRYVKKDSSEVKFTLPDGYAFLQVTEKTGSIELNPDPDPGGGYSCTCSGKNSCKTFYNSDTGYGCLHSDCTGTCTGKATTASGRILGVLSKENDHLQFAVDVSKKASLSAEGMKAFFQLPEVRAQIKKNYDFVYKNLPKPDFENIDPANLPSGYFMGKFSLMGVEIGLVLPKDEGLLKARPELRSAMMNPAPTSCACSGTPGGDNCKLHKDCLLGYCAYYCDGCQTCTMN